MKVLFLDIDGVLNSRKWYQANKEAINLDSGLMWRHEKELDPAACALVQGLCVAEDLKIVISSTWRRLHTIGEIQNMFANCGLFAEIIGSTPQLRSGFRGQEINEWLHDHREVTKYVILDDDADFVAGQPLVQTNNDVGVTGADIWEAKEILR